MKNIGVCVSLTQAEITKEFLNALHIAAKKVGYKLVCFNSSVDFDFNESPAAESIFHTLPFEYLDALVILHGTFNNSELEKNILADAKKANVPVIMAREKNENTYSVSGRYENAFTELIRHIVLDHNCKDIFYISGREDLSADSNSDSAIRYHILSKTLKELGISFDESHVACGEYWEHPTIRVIDEMMASGRKLPDAIVCANDIMASTTAQRLKKYGINVPEDVIVTGFDGLQSAHFSEPRLATCYDDISEMSSLIMKLLDDIFNGAATEQNIYYDYKAVFADSCGCRGVNDFHEKKDIELFRAYRMNEADEDFANKWLNDLFAENTVDYFKKSVPAYLRGQQAVVIRTDDAYLQDESFGDEFVPLFGEYRLFSNIDNLKSGKYADRNDVIKCIFEDDDLDAIYVSTVIYVKNLVLGIYIEKIYDALIEGATYNRHVHTVNNGLIACLSQERHDVLKKNVEINKYKDSLTGLDNIRGFQRYFESFDADPANHETYYEYCIFSFINHDEIFNNFKTEGVEKCLTFIANTLIDTHPSMTYVARVSTTAFVVIVHSDSDDKRSGIVWSAVSDFYERIQQFNESDPDGPQIEVSSGSIDLNPGWSGTNASFTSSAYAELYKNRNALGDGFDGDGNIDITSESEILNKVHLIIRENRLTYVYQPIVDVKTGDIVAYEALMRTKGDIHMSPLELLDVARRHRILYHIERLTIFNILEDYVQRQMAFEGRALFINTIPGSFLKDEDIVLLKDKYGKHLEKVVLEITEDKSIDEDELKKIRFLNEDKEMVKIAIDDFGTGHSNVVNLMQYEPQIIKIDRFLISGLHRDKNKQMFVANIVSFAKDNGIKVLAEGVETRDELEIVIKLGVDYAQGFYLAKPSPEVIRELPAEVLNAFTRFPIHVSNLTPYQ